MRQNGWKERVRTFLRADAIQECQDQVAEENIKMMCFLDVLMMVFSFGMGCYTVFTENRFYVSETLYGVYFLLAAVMLVFTEKVVAKNRKLLSFMILINYFSWVSYFILENIIFRPRMYITTYYALVGLGVCFLVKPLRALTLQAVTGLVLGICIYFFEPKMYARTDMLNAIVMLGIDIVLGFEVLRFRMNALRKNADKMRETQVAALYQSIIDETQTGIYVRELGTYEVLYLNRKAKEIFNLQGDDWVGEKCYRLFYQQDAVCTGCAAKMRNMTGDPIQEILQGGHYYAVKGNVIDWNGREACVEYLFDVTDAKKVSEQMRMENENLRKKYEEELVYREKAVSEDILSTSRINLTQGIVEEMRVGGMDGYERQYRSEMEFRERIRAFTKESWLTDEQNRLLSREGLLEQFKNEQNSVTEKYVAELKDGKHVWIRVEINLLQRPESSEVMAFIYNRDVSREGLLRYSIEHIMSFEYDEIYAVDSVSGNFESVAVGQYAMQGQLAEGRYDEELKNLVLRAVNEEDREKIQKEMSIDALRQILATEQTHVFEVTLISWNGKPRRKQIRCVYMNKEIGILLIAITDIEDVVKKEKEKQEQLAQTLSVLREANRAKSSFLASMSHEIRTPMNAIIGLNAIIKEEVGNREQILDCTEKLDSASRYLLALLNDILDSSRIESGNMTIAHQAFYMDKFWDNVNILARAQADISGVRYLFARERGVAGKYVGDEIRMQQIMINLINNAIKFTPEGGYVKVDVTEKEMEDGRARVCATVEDNGIGISEEFLPKVFGTFAQEHDGNTTSYKGSGLGLSIARSFARMMDGDITVESEEGVGTTFTVWVKLDVAEEDNCVTEEERPEKDADTVRYFEGYRVILAEDHPLNIVVAKGLLNKRGFEVTTVENGAEAVRCFADSAPGTFDAILMDIRMPVLDGIGATMQIRAMEREDAGTIPIIAMTANAYEEDRRQTAEAGMNAHLAKPIDPSQLFKTLDEFIPAKVV